MDLTVSQRVKSQSLSMVVTRADGRVEDLGVVGYWHRNPLMRLFWRLKKLARQVTA